MKRFRIKISEKEHLHLLNVAGYKRTVTTAFGPGNVWITEDTAMWAIEEIACLRGIVPPNKLLQPNLHTTQID